jgi:hypothetical protein
MNVKLFFPVIVAMFAISGTAGLAQWPMNSGGDAPHARQGH